MTARQQARPRWVRLGQLRTRHYVSVANIGFPYGYLMSWRQPPEWCQPMQFIYLEHVHWAWQRRLAIAGLEAQAFASELCWRAGLGFRPLWGGAEVWALVRRRSAGKLICRKDSKRITNEHERTPGPVMANLEAAMADEDGGLPGMETGGELAGATEFGDLAPGDGLRGASGREGGLCAPPDELSAEG